MRSISVSSYFFCPPSYYFKGFCCLSYIIWSTWLVSAAKQDFMSSSWQGKDNCGKSVCAKWYCSDLVGQIPMIVVLFQGKGCPPAHHYMLCLGRCACPQNITVNNQIFFVLFVFYFISGILKCFLSFCCSFYQL